MPATWSRHRCDKHSNPSVRITDSSIVTHEHWNGQKTLPWQYRLLHYNLLRLGPLDSTDWSMARPALPQLPGSRSRFQLVQRALAIGIWINSLSLSLSLSLIYFLVAPLSHAGRRRDSPAVGRVSDTSVHFFPRSLSDGRLIFSVDHSVTAGSVKLLVSSSLQSAFRSVCHVHSCK